MNADEGCADQGSTGPTPIAAHHPRAIRVHPRSSAAKTPCRPRRVTTPPAMAPEPAPPTAEAPTPPSLLPGRRGGPRSRRQHLQRRHRPVIRIPKERPPLRLGHVLTARIWLHRVRVRLEPA